MKLNELKGFTTKLIETDVLEILISDKNGILDHILASTFHACSFSKKFGLCLFVFPSYVTLSIINKRFDRIIQFDYAKNIMLCCSCMGGLTRIWLLVYYTNLDLGF